MAVREIICAFIFAASLNLILTIENTDEYFQIEKNARVVGRAYSLVGCDYGTQAGYSCMTCNRALHCYIGGVAIMVDCYGLLRYCRDGRCGRQQGDKCSADSKLTTPLPYQPFPGMINITIPQTQTSNDNPSRAAQTVQSDISDVASSDGIEKAEGLDNLVQKSNGGDEKANDENSVY